MSLVWKRLCAAALMLPLVLLAISSTTYAAMLCAMRGVVTTECCCGPSKPSLALADAPAADEAPDRVSRPACCTTVELHVERAPSIPARDPADGPPLPIAVAFPTGVLAFTRPDVVLLPRSAGIGQVQPPPSRRLLLAKRSFLI